MRYDFKDGKLIITLSIYRADEYYDDEYTVEIPLKELKEQLSNA